MGLDTIELVLDIEERFETRLPDTGAEKLHTVGQLHAFLMKRIRAKTASFCPSAAMFYSTRRILTDSFGVNREAIRPATVLESILHDSNRRRFWRTIQYEITATLPPMKRSKLLQWSGDRFPSECDTVGRLVQYCVDANKITAEFGPSDDELVWRTVRKIVAKFARVDEFTITHDTAFVNDLGF